MPRRQAQAEYVAGGGNWIAESPYYRSLPTYIDDITRDFGNDAYERMMLDDQVASSVRTYVESILSDPLTVRPWIDDDKNPDYEEAKQYAEFAERLLANCSPTRSVDAWLFEMVGGSVSLGNRVAEKVARLEESGQDAGRLVWDRLKVKPRNRTAFVVDGFSNLLGLLAAIPGEGNLVPGAILTPDLLAVSNLLPREKFAILSWAPQEEDPRGTSLLRTVYKLWWEKIQATAEWLKHLTQFGSPSLWGTTAPDAMAEPATDSLGNPLPGGVSISPVQQLLNEFLKFRNGYALALPNGATVQLLQSANAGDAFLKMVEHHERAIDRAILLAARTRMEAKHGSKADSETSQDITGQAVRRAKTWVADMVTRDLIRPMILWNFGPDAAKRLCPYASLAPVEHQDWSQTANAVAPLVASGFLKPSQFAAMYDKLGLPPAEEPLTDEQQQGAGAAPVPGDEDFPAAAATATEAPFAAGEYEETKHPRGYGGKWAQKPGSEQEPSDNERAAQRLRQLAQGATPDAVQVLHQMAVVLQHGPVAAPSKPYDYEADVASMRQEDTVKVFKRLAKRDEDRVQAERQAGYWQDARHDGRLKKWTEGLTPEQKTRIEAEYQRIQDARRRPIHRVKAAEQVLRERPAGPREALTPENVARAVVVEFHSPLDARQRAAPGQKRVTGGEKTVAGLLKVLPQADVLGLHAARVYFLPPGLKVDDLNAVRGVYAQSLTASTKEKDPEFSPGGILWTHSAAPVQVPVEQIPPDARYGGQSQRRDTGTFEPGKVDQYKRLSKSLYVRQKAGEEVAYDIVLAKEVPRLIGIPKHLLAEFAEYEEHLHPRGYGGKWASKGTDQTHEQHTEQLTWRGQVANLLRQALSQPGKSVARALAAAEALHDAYRQGGFKAVPKVAVLTAYRKAKASFAKLEARYGRKTAIAMAGAYLSCYAAYAANPVLMLYLPSPTAAILGTAEALRALGKGARKLAGKKGEAVFADDGMDFDPDYLPVDLEDFLDSLPDNVEFAFGLPTPYEEGKHPRGYGGKWTNKPGAGRFAAAGKAHQAAEKELQKHERALARSAAKVEKLHQAHVAAKVAHAAAKKRVPKGKSHGREALEAHQAELAAIRAKGKLDAHKAAHAEARKAHKTAQSAHGKTGKELAKAQKELAKEPGKSPEKKPAAPKKEPKPKKATAKTKQLQVPDVPGFRPGDVKVDQAAYIPDDKPIQDRIKDYTRGDQLVQAMAAIDRVRDWASQRSIAAARELDWETYRQAVGIQDQYTGIGGRDAAHQILAEHVDNKVDWRSDVKGDLDPNVRLAHDQGMEFLRNTISKGHSALSFQTTAQVQQIPKDLEQRAYHHHVSGVHLSEKSNAGVMVHEFGHWLDEHMPGVLEATQAFLKYRVGNEPTESMADVSRRVYGHSNGYGADEMGRKDHFDRAFPEVEAYYTGKNYGGHATEVLSMGLEKLYNDPVHFAQKDPEFFKFILGICDGSLRDHDPGRIDLIDLGDF